MPDAIEDVKARRSSGSVPLDPVPLGTGPDVPCMSAPGVTGITCAVRLIDRRSGLAQRINGKLFTIYTKHPQETAAEMMRGRDASCWEARVDPLTTREVAR